MVLVNVRRKSNYFLRNGKVGYVSNESLPSMRSLQGSFCLFQLKLKVSINEHRSRLHVKLHYYLAFDVTSNNSWNECNLKELLQCWITANFFTKVIFWNKIDTVHSFVNNDTCLWCKWQTFGNFLKYSDRLWHQCLVRNCNHAIIASNKSLRFNAEFINHVLLHNNRQFSILTM